MNIISLGVGVQSSTMSEMAERGLIEPMPDAAIFADTGAEPTAVYEYLDALKKRLSFPVYRVMKQEGLRKNIIESIKGKRLAGAPFFTESKGKRGGMLRRQCTREFKVEPITKKIRELLGAKKYARIKGVPVTQWLGISTDEASRMRDSRECWIKHRFPLIELGMSRKDCLEWMAKNGLPKPSKSACTFCPYHDDGMWRDMKQNDPRSWADAIEIDEMIRAGVRGTKQQLFVHRSLTPLADVDFRTAEEAGQLNMFNNECEGMCGV